MALLNTVDSKFFHTEIPYKPMGKYVHFLTVCVTESYPVIIAATITIETLMSEEFIVHTDFIDSQFNAVLSEVKALTGHEDGIKRILQQADAEAKAYAKKHIKLKPESDKAKAGKAAKAG